MVELRISNDEFRIREKITKNYLLAGAFAGAFATGTFAVAVFVAALAAGAAALAFALAAVFAFVSVLAAVFAFASAEFAFEFADVAASVPSGLLDSTETLPFRAGIARNSAESMNNVAAAIVTLDKTVAVPRGANAELDTLLVNNAPASVLPG